MKAWQTILAVVLGVGLLLGIVWFVFLRADDRIGVSTPPPRERDTLRLATFNIEGLFGPGADAPSSDAHLTIIAKAIQAIDADILALQDVESLETVEWYRDTLLPGMGYDFIASLDVGHKRGIENAILSRHPIETSRVWRTLKLGGKHPATAGGEPNPYAGQPIRFRRSPLMVQITLPAAGTGNRKPLTLFVIEHKGGDRFDYWREAEAKAIVKLAHAAGMNDPIIILGSFHAAPSDATMQIYDTGGFMDALGVERESTRWATETTGDRTDYILANRVAMSIIDADTGFVLGGDLVSLQRETTHLPLVVGLQNPQE